MITAVDSTSQDDGWASMSAVGNFLNNTDASFDPRNYGFPKLTRWPGRSPTSRSSRGPATRCGSG